MNSQDNKKQNPNSTQAQYDQKKLFFERILLSGNITVPGLTFTQGFCPIPMMSIPQGPLTRRKSGSFNQSPITMHAGREWLVSNDNAKSDGSFKHAMVQMGL